MGLEVENVEEGKKRKPVADYVLERGRSDGETGRNGCRPIASN